MRHLKAADNRFIRVIRKSFRNISTVILPVVLGLGVSTAALCEGLPPPTWGSSDDLESLDGYAELAWNLPAGVYPDLYRIVQTRPGDRQVSYVDVPRLHVYRREAGWYDFRIQSCSRVGAGVPQCGESTDKLRLTVRESAEVEEFATDGQETSLAQAEPGPEQLRPGAWISVDEQGNTIRDGQGWNFYWASRLALDQSDPLFGSAFDLVGIWYTFEAKKWIISGPSAAPGAYRPVAAELKLVRTGDDTYQGDVWVTRNGQPASIGQATIVFGANNTYANISLSSLSFKLETRPSISNDAIVLLLGADPSSANNSSHYSGLWRPIGVDDVLVDHNLGSIAEVANVIFPDEAGDPTWVQAVSTQFTNSMVDLCLRYLDTGYPPDHERPAGWVSSISPSPWHDSGCDGTQSAAPNNRNSSREFAALDRNHFWASLDLPDREFATGSLSLGSSGSPAVMEKTSAINGIRYSSVSGSNCELSQSNPACTVDLTWFTAGDYPGATAFSHQLSTGLRVTLATSGSSAVEGFELTLEDADTYIFELRMGAESDSELIAQSGAFVVSHSTDQEIPVVPSGLHGTWAGGSAVAFSMRWTQADTASVDYYEIEELRPDGSQVIPNLGVSPGTLVFQDYDKSGQLQGMYRYRIRACNGAGCSEFSPPLHWFTVDPEHSEIWLDDFESPSSWQTNPDGTDTAYRGEWEVSNPAETRSGGYVFQPGSTTSGVKALVTDGRAGSSIFAYDVDGGRTSVESGIVELPSGSQPIILRFNYYFSNSSPGNDNDHLRLFVEHGASETAVFEVRGTEGIQAAQWTAAGIDLTPLAGQKVRLRFEATDGTDYGVAVESGIDDVQVLHFALPNTPPRFVSPSDPPEDQTTVETGQVELQMYAVDDEDNIAGYSATGLPTGLQIEESTGLIAGTIESGASALSPFSVTVLVTDLLGLSDQVSFQWFVEPAQAENQSPSIIPPGDQQGELGDFVTLQMAATDPDADDHLIFSASGLPASLGIDGETGLISGVLDGQAGNYAVEVTVIDGRGGSDLAAFTWTLYSGQASASPETPPPPAGPPAMTPTVASSSIGATRGQASIDAKGSAIYEIPILTAPGAGGFSPELGLKYSSNSGNGPLGMGWGLQGLSAITRCSRTLEQDRITGRVGMNSHDRFCLDGSRLLLVAGRYGGDGAEYRSEIDELARIRSHGVYGSGPASFTVEHKDGRVSQYGGSSNAQVRVGGEILTWGRSRIEDRAANFITYRYLQESGAAEFLIDRIEYTGNSRAPTEPYARLEFAWAGGRGDSTMAFVGGVAVQQSKYLVRIDSLAKAKTASPYSSLRSYFLGYATDGMGRKSLRSLVECNNSAQQACFPPTRFDWIDSLHGFSAGISHNNVLESNKVLYGLQLSDVSGDGRPDLLYTKKVGSQYKLSIAAPTGAGQFLDWGGSYTLPKKENGAPPRIYGIDLNADGFSDVIYRKHSSNGRYQWVGRLSSGVSLEQERVLTDSSFELDETDPSIEERLSVLDFNGDGLSDVLYNRTSELGDEHQLEVAINTWSPGQAVGLSASMEITSAFEGLFPSLALDVNGDTWETFDKPQFGEWSSVQLEGRNTPGGRFFDYNGDGAVDLLINVWREYRNCTSLCPDPKSAGSNESVSGQAAPTYQYQVVSFWVLMSTTGNGTYSSEIIGTGTGCGLPNPCENTPGVPVTDLMWPVDLNADGLADIAFTDNGSPNRGKGWHYRLNLGNGFGLTQSVTRVPSPIPAGAEDAARFEDMNGDGYPDLIFPSAIQNQLATWLVIYNNFGLSFSDPEPTALKAGNVGGDLATDTIENDASLFVDFNGDGRKDHFYINFNAHAKPNDSDLYLGRNILSGSTSVEASNVMVGITDGFGAIVQFSYAPLTDGLVYTRMRDASNASWGEGAVVYDLVAPIYVVSSLSSSAPTFASGLAMRETNYHYVGAKMQGGGRGFLGFGEVITYDPQLGVRTNTRYRQDFPFISQVADAARAIASTAQRFDPLSQVNAQVPASWGAVAATTGVPSHTGSLLSYSINGWSQRPTEGGSVLVHLASSLKRDYTLAGGFSRKQLVSTTIDAYGNPISSTSRTYATDGETEFARQHTVNTYNNDPNNWNVDRLTTTRLTLSRAGATDITRESRFAYDSETGILNEEELEPNKSPYRVTSRYILDAFGHQVRTTVTGQGMSPRSSYSTYDPLGRLEIESRNDLGQIIRRAHEWDAFGNVLESSDIDGVLSFVVPDLMGRPFASYVETGGHLITIRSFSTTSCPAGTAMKIYRTGGGTPAKFDCLDILGRSTKTATKGFDGSWNVVDQYFDRSGRAERVSEPYHAGATRDWNLSAYDAMGRMIALSAADGDDQLFEYDDDPDIRCTAVNVRVKQTTNGLGQVQVETRDATGKALDVYDDACGRISYSYDAAGNLKQVTGADNATVRMAYDLAGRKLWLDDPDKGYWQYAYNPLGELTRQMDSKSQAIDYSYDTLGRVTERRELTGVSSLADSNFVTQNRESTSYRDSTTGSVTGKGKPLSVTYRAGESGMVLHQRNYEYDAYGRLSQATTVVEEGAFMERTTYDQFGRVFQQFDASGDGRGIRFIYNAMGYLDQLKEAREGVAGQVYKDVVAMDAWGNATHVVLGNGVDVFASYRADNGHLTKLSAFDGAVELQDIDYLFDVLGNLEQRHDKSASLNIRESFDYDQLNRLQSADLSVNGGSATQTLSLNYDPAGNITHKSDVGHYEFSGPQPHAVTSAGGVSYSYDANGNQVTGNGRTIGYTVFDQAKRITRGSSEVRIEYGVANARYKREDLEGGVVQKTTHYLGAVERIDEGGRLYFKRQIGGIAVATLYPSTGAQAINYLLKDHIGSIHTVLDHSARVVAGMHFSAFGERQSTDWRTPVGSGQYANLNNITTRGFTGHEHVDDLGVIHMNGRIYDPMLGRFLQADPVVQAPKNSQNLNRYTYVLNNPLSYTDPSGFFLNRLIKKWGRVIIAAIVSYNTFGWASNLAWTAAPSTAAGVATTSAYVTSASIGGFAAGFVGGAIISGTARGALKGAFSGAIAGGIAGYFGNFYSGSRVVSDSLAGGISAEINGQRFKDGLLFSALVSSATLVSVKARAYQVKKSRLFFDQIGDSAGYRGIPGKLAGERIYEEIWIESGAAKLNELGAPREEIVAAYLAKRLEYGQLSPLGALQLSDRLLFGRPYKSGGFLDYIVEGYSGMHDTLNQQYFYHANGTNRLIRGALNRSFGKVLNTANVILASPVVIPALVPDVLRHLYFQENK